MTTINSDRSPGSSTKQRRFPGGLDTTVVYAEESGRAPFDGITVPATRWKVFADDFSAAYAFVSSEDNREFYARVNAEILEIAKRQK